MAGQEPHWPIVRVVEITLLLNVGAAPFITLYIALPLVLFFLHLSVFPEAFSKLFAFGLLDPIEQTRVVLEIFDDITLDAIVFKRAALWKFAIPQQSLLLGDVSVVEVSLQVVPEVSQLLLVLLSHS